MDLDLEPVPVLIQSYRDVLSKMGTTQGLIVVDGPNVFRKSAAGNGDFFDQVHPSASGHALLGTALAEALEPAISSR